MLDIEIRELRRKTKTRLRRVRGRDAASAPARYAEIAQQVRNAWPLDSKTTQELINEIRR